MRISNLILTILTAVSLCFVLFAQDQTSVFEIGPTDDLPEMMTSIVKSPTEQLEQLDPQPVTPVSSQPALAQIPPRSIASDCFPRACAYCVLLVWLLNNPPTAPPTA